MESIADALAEQKAKEAAKSKQATPPKERAAYIESLKAELEALREVREREGGREDSAWVACRSRATVPPPPLRPPSAPLPAPPRSPGIRVHPHVLTPGQYRPPREPCLCQCDCLRTRREQGRGCGDPGPSGGTPGASIGSASARSDDGGRDAARQPQAPRNRPIKPSHAGQVTEG